PMPPSLAAGRLEDAELEVQPFERPPVPERGMAAEVATVADQAVHVAYVHQPEGIRLAHVISPLTGSPSSRRTCSTCPRSKRSAGNPGAAARLPSNADGTRECPETCVAGHTASAVQGSPPETHDAAFYAMMRSPCLRRPIRRSSPNQRPSPTAPSRFRPP